MAYCYFIHGTRGSGKGAFAVHRIKDALLEGRKVATNMTLYLDHLLPEDSYAKVVRLPDIPSGHHLQVLGLAYDFNPDDPSTIDPSKEGVLFLDEIKLFLTKSNKEFHEIVNWLVQSRKFGWNIYLTGQHKDQAEDTVYKSLTDKLIVCRDESKFLGKFLKLFSFLNLPFLTPSDNKAYIFDGRSELDDLDKTISYDWRPVKLAYSTAQIFSMDNIYLTDKFIDMRSLFTYLPPAYLTRYHFIKQYQDKIDTILNPAIKEGSTMAVPTSKNGMSMGNKLKIGVMVLGVVVYYSFSNPLDNPMIKKVMGETEQVQIEQPVIHQSYQSQPVYSVPVSQPADDFILDLFSQYDAKLSSLFVNDVYGVLVSVDFYKDGKIVERLTSDDFHYHGYSVQVINVDSVFITSPNFKKRLSSSRVFNQPIESPNKAQSVASDLISSTTLF